MLPKSYQEVEYLESTGTQWLDTGVVPHIGCELYCRFMFTGTSYTKNQSECLFSAGSSGDSSSTLAIVYQYVQGVMRTYYSYFGKGSSPYHDGDAYDTWHDLRFDDGNITISDSFTAQCTVAEEISGSHCNLIVFDNTTHTVPARCRISSLTLAESNTLVINLVPCYRISDNKPGMYDTVRDLFLTNQGEGEFVTGPPVYPPMYRQTHPYEMGRRRKALISATLGGGLPSGYQRVEYLESTSGANQWIDTGIVPTIDTGIELVKLGTGGTYLNNYLGVGETASNQYQVSAGDVRFDGWSKDTTALRPQGTVLVWHRILYFNGEQILNFTNATDSVANITLTLWCKHSKSTSTIRYSVAKFCSFKMWDANDKLVLNLIPCYRKSDNKPGMYDTVSKQFLVNQGSGADFTLGPNV